MTQTLGVDLGTTNTVAAVGQRVIKLGARRPVLPSVVAFLPNGTVQTGAVARSRRAIDGKNTIYSSKRIIGRSWDDPASQEFMERYPFDFVQLESGPAFATRAGEFTATQIAAILLSSIHEKLGSLASEVELVVTVPVGFSERQRFATLEAAGKARFENVRVLEEPVAAAGAYRSQLPRLERVAVYDLGGGTFDFAIVDCGAEEPRVLRSASDMFLGGDDIDARIADWVVTEVLKRHNWDLKNHPEVYNRLLGECERAKIQLSTWERTKVDLSQVDPQFEAAAEALPLGRELLDELADALVRRTFITCDTVLRELDLQPRDVDAVLLAGGSTHLPMVQRGVEAYFGRPGAAEIPPTEVVALGATSGLA